MRIAVTGASGFLGRQAVSLLAREGVEVVAISRHPDAPISRSVTPLKFDIAEICGNAFERIGCPDVLMHFAWGGLPNYQNSTHLDVELPRQIAFLDACVTSGLRRMVVAGTCLEYGIQSGCLDESLPALPTTAYGQAKDRLRQHLQQHIDVTGLQLVWARLFYLYGDGQASTSLYSQLRTAVENRATEFHMSPGDQERDFLAVDLAVARLCTLALNRPKAGLVNICGGVARPVESWVRKWLADWDAELALKLGAFPYPDYEAHAFWGSTKKLEQLLETP